MIEVNDNNIREFGVVLFEKSNAKHMLDAPTGNVSAKGKAIRIYLILLGVALFGWLYIVLSTWQPTPKKAS